MDPARDQERPRTAVVVCDATVHGFPILDVDEGFEALTGWRLDEIAGRGCSFLQGSDADPDAVAGMARALREGRSHRAVLLNRRKDGTRFFNQVSLAAVREGGRVVRYVGMLEDVTTEVHEQRRSSVLAAAVEGADAAIWTIGPDLRIRTWNRGAERQYGFRPHDVIGRSHLEMLIPEADRARVRADMEQRLVEGGTSRHELTHLRADGTELPVQVTRSVVRSADGSVTGLASMAVDLSERRELEARVADLEARLGAILASVPAIVWEADLDGTLLLSEGAALALVGLQPGASVGRRIDELYADNEAVLDGWRRALAGERAEATVEVGGVWLDTVHAPRLDAEGRVIGTAGVAIDARARVEAERRSRELELHLERSQRLETVGRLAGGVAHEFNNLLSVIRGSMSFVAEALGDEHPAQADLVAARKATDRAVALTRQLLTAAQQEVPKPRPLDVGALLRDMEPLLRQAVQATVDLELGLPAAPAVVHADPAQLEQVVLNLVVNARDAMPAGGALGVRVGRRDVRDGRVPDGRYVVLEVRDTGEGMAPDVVERAFEPFFTTKPPGQGTGLGLATVYGIATQAGGAVELDSSRGRGTTVRVLLPSQPVAAPAADAPTVLVVEDDEAVRVLTRRILERDGLQVLQAANGAEALELLEARDAPVDLVVTDVVMPVLGGKELADRLEAGWPGVPVLFCSGYADDAVLRHGVEAGRYALLRKPFDAAELVAAVRERLGAVA